MTKIKITKDKTQKESIYRDGMIFDSKDDIKVEIDTNELTLPYEESPRESNPEYLAMLEEPTEDTESQIKEPFRGDDETPEEVKNLVVQDTIEEAKTVELTKDEEIITRTRVDENNNFVTKMMDGEVVLFEGVGTDLEKSFNNLIYNLKKAEIEDRKNQVMLFLEKNRENAIQLATNILQFLNQKISSPSKWFTLQELGNKTGVQKEELSLKINFLKQFSMIESDRDSGAGMRYRVLLNNSDQRSVLSKRIELYEQELSILKTQFQKLHDDSDSKISSTDNN